MSLRFGIKRLLSLGDLIATRNVNITQRRQQSTVSSKPGNPLKTWEKLFYGGIMAVGILFLPVHTLYNLREYSGTKANPKN